MDNAHAVTCGNHDVCATTEIYVISEVICKKSAFTSNVEVRGMAVML